MEDHVYDLVIGILDRNVYAKLKERTGDLLKAYKICYTKRYLVKDVWNPITEAVEHRLICNKTKAIILRWSELEPTLQKLHEKTGTWNHARLLEYIDGKLAIGPNILRNFVKTRSRVVPKYIALSHCD